MRYGLKIILSLLITLILTQTVIADVNTDVLVNLVKQETGKTQNYLTVKIDTKFTELETQFKEKIDVLDKKINEDINSKLNFMLLKFSIALFCSFFLALLLYRFIVIKQERNNPFYLEFKKKQQEVKTAIKLDKQNNKIKGFKQKVNIESEKEALNDLKGRLKRPNRPINDLDNIYEGVKNGV